MIRAVGVSGDPTMAHFVETASAGGVTVEMIDLGDQARGRWRMSVPPCGADSWLQAEHGLKELSADVPTYCRLIDLGAHLLGQAMSWHLVVEAWNSWLELAPAPVVNRPGHPGHNSSKPLHGAVLTGLGFQVPPSVTTSDPEVLQAFAATAPCIAKPLSGQRADCRRIVPADFDAYVAAQGPVHLQRLVEGIDVRAHVVGDVVVAQRVVSTAFDYRTDRSAVHERIELDPALEARLVSASEELGLGIAGWDLLLEDDRAWTLEVNPMPGYSYYDDHVSGAITAALVEYLLDETRRR